MPKELTDLTNEEIKSILQISKSLNQFLKDWKISELSRKKVEIELGNYIVRKSGNQNIWKGEGKYIEINENGVFTYQLPSCHKTTIKNPFQVAQYLIDKGYRFELF